MTNSEGATDDTQTYAYACQLKKQGNKAAAIRQLMFLLEKWPSSPLASVSREHLEDWQEHAGSDDDFDEPFEHNGGAGRKLLLVIVVVAAIVGGVVGVKVYYKASWIPKRAELRKTLTLPGKGRFTPRLFAFSDISFEVDGGKRKIDGIFRTYVLLRRYARLLKGVPETKLLEYNIDVGDAFSSTRTAYNRLTLNNGFGTFIKQIGKAWSAYAEIPKALAKLSKYKSFKVAHFISSHMKTKEPYLRHAYAAKQNYYAVELTVMLENLDKTTMQPKSTSFRLKDSQGRLFPIRVFKTVVKGNPVEPVELEPTATATYYMIARYPKSAMSPKSSLRLEFLDNTKKYRESFGLSNSNKVKRS